MANSYLKIDDAKSGLKTKGYEDQIPITEYTWGLSRFVTVKDSKIVPGPGRCSSLTVTKNADASSAALVDIWKKKASDAPIAEVTITTPQADKPFVQLTLKKVYIASIEFQGRGESATESVSFVFEEVGYKVLDSTPSTFNQLTRAQ